MEKDVLKDTFTKAGLAAEVEVYANAAHGWCPPDSGVYNEPQAEKAWSPPARALRQGARVIKRRRTMQKTTIALVFGLAGLAAGSWLSTASSAAGTSYGEDRAQIEDLQARYLFALDFHDPQLYASTFTPDGILDYGEGDVKGREAIIKVIGGMPATTASPKGPDGATLRPSAGRHQITNIVIKVDGNKAIGPLVVVPRRQRQPATRQHHRRLRPLRGRDGEGERAVVLHQAEDLQRRQRPLAVQGRPQPGLVVVGAAFRRPRAG